MLPKDSDPKQATLPTVGEEQVGEILRTKKNVREILPELVDALVELLGLNVSGEYPHKAVKYDVRALAVLLAGYIIFDFCVWLHSLFDLLVQQRTPQYIAVFCVFTACLYAVIAGLVNRSLFVIPTYDDNSQERWTRLWLKLRIGGRGTLVIGVSALTTLLALLQIFDPQITRLAGEEAILAEMAERQWQNGRIQEDHGEETKLKKAATDDGEKAQRRLTELRAMISTISERLEKSKVELEIAESSARRLSAEALRLKRMAAEARDAEEHETLTQRASRVSANATAMRKNAETLEDSVQRDEGDLKLHKAEELQLSEAIGRANGKVTEHAANAAKLKHELDAQQSDMRKRYEAVRNGRCEPQDKHLCEVKLTLAERGRLLNALMLGMEPRWPPFVSKEQRLAALRAHGLLADGEELARHRAEDAAVLRQFSCLALLIALFLPIMLVFYKAFLLIHTQRYLARAGEISDETQQIVPLVPEEAPAAEE